jgi:hypothetical protein
MEDTIRKLEVSWSYEAEIQYYDTLLFWIEKTKSEKYSEKIEKEVAKISNTLKTFPKIGAIYESKGIRRVIIFSIFYRILEEQNEIEIIAFCDNRNDPEKLQF